MARFYPSYESDVELELVTDIILDIELPEGVTVVEQFCAMGEDRTFGEFFVDWGDGEISQYYKGELFSVTPTHTYAQSGRYTVRVYSYSRGLTRFLFSTRGSLGSGTTDQVIVGIRKYWSLVISYLERVFSEQQNMEFCYATFSQEDLPSFKNASLDYAFYRWISFNGTLPDRFMCDIAPTVTGVRWTFANWYLFDKPLPEDFCQPIFQSKELIEFEYTFNGWNSFNQPLPTKWFTDVAHIVDFTNVMSGWNVFNQELPQGFMSDLQSAVVLRNALRGWHAFNQELPQGFMSVAPKCEDAVYLFGDWRVFDRPLPNGFMADIATIVNFENTFFNWYRFNQPLPEGFMVNTVSATDFQSCYGGWYRFNQPLPEGFMVQIDSAVSFGSAFSLWDAFDQDLPEGFMVATQNGRYFQGTFNGWQAFNRPLPDGFMTRIEQANIRMDQCFNNWRVFNQPLQSNFVGNGEEIINLYAAFNDWRSFNQQLPDNFLTATSKCTAFNICFANWRVYTGPMVVLKVDSVEQVPAFYGVYRNNALMEGAANDIISQRTDWVQFCANENTLQPGYCQPFINCTSLSDYATIPDDWK